MTISHYNGEPLNKFKLSKREVMEFLWLIDKRYQNNPEVPAKIKKYCHYNLKLMDWQLKESDMPYIWDMTFQISDGLRALNDRKGNPELEKLNPMFKEELQHQILTVKKQAPLHDLKAALISKELLAEAKEKVKTKMMFGAMQDG